MLIYELADFFQNDLLPVYMRLNMLGKEDEKYKDLLDELELLLKQNSITDSIEKVIEFHEEHNEYVHEEFNIMDEKMRKAQAEAQEATAAAEQASEDTTTEKETTGE